VKGLDGHKMLIIKNGIAQAVHVLRYAVERASHAIAEKFIFRAAPAGVGLLRLRPQTIHGCLNSSRARAAQCAHPQTKIKLKTMELSSTASALAIHFKMFIFLLGTSTRCMFLYEKVSSVALLFCSAERL
jgi:hypothetical protein